MLVKAACCEIIAGETPVRHRRAGGLSYFSSASWGRGLCPVAWPDAMAMLVNETRPTRNVVFNIPKQISIKKSLRERNGIRGMRARCQGKRRIDGSTDALQTDTRAGPSRGRRGDGRHAPVSLILTRSSSNSENRGRTRSLNLPTIMRMLGIIGGTGPESTIEYYRRLNAAFRERSPEGRAPLVVINSIDNTKLLKLV